ncbi:MAG: hypothetical protein EVB02_03910 [SAR92 clade bacterium]|uniref:Uncharacterized protein n=1 Tax=SAR92 clade bacterium TaxID=2315479 RepID=A0A520LJX0_9GAMM|nr:MAG: hypothetical protein EVB02_03910 [SAR92 clade bacterium]|tara:strand:+ start:2373 stop:3563 length:1191 start_codon:yes stop_codon:yes gene_type:complete
MQKLANDDVLNIREFFDSLYENHMGDRIGRVGYKFLVDMLDGIHQTRSVNLTTIARGLNEKIRLHATHKRLSRNLDDEDILNVLSNALLHKGAAAVQADTKLIITMHDLNKKYASKIEYLSELGKEEQSGFRVCEVLAVNHESESYFPLYESIWSDQIPGFVDDATEVIKVIDKVFEATNNKGMLVLDDLTLSSNVITEVILQSRFNFISMANHFAPEVEFEEEIYSASSLADKLETSFGKMMFKYVPGDPIDSIGKDVDLFVHAGAFSVKLVKTDEILSLITLKTRNRFVGEVSVPILTTAKNLKSRKKLMGLVDSYLSKNDVLLQHRYYRERFDLSGFRVLKFSRLNLLITLVQAVMFYEISTGSFIMKKTPLFSKEPHEGNMNRTYYKPDKNG